MIYNEFRGNVQLFHLLCKILRICFTPIQCAPKEITRTKLLVRHVIIRVFTSLLSTLKNAMKIFDFDKVFTIVLSTSKRTMRIFDFTII